MIGVAAPKRRPVHPNPERCTMTHAKPQSRLIASFAPSCVVGSHQAACYLARRSVQLDVWAVSSVCV